MKKYIYIILLILPLGISSNTFAQCTPTNCIATLPPYGGICDTLLLTDTVGQFYSDFESFHTTTNCFDAGLINIAFAGIGAIINSAHTFTYTGLPTGITAASNLASYTSPANGCVLFQGTPTQAGVFEVTINFLVNATAYPISGGACTGFSIVQNDNAVFYIMDLIILPDASFTIPSTNFCASDAAVNLTITGTTGGSFTGPGVTGTSFDPSIAGAGTHTLYYTVSAQQGSAIAPSTNYDSVIVTVVAPSFNYYVDADTDGYGENGSTPITTCSAITPPGYANNDTDCDDALATVNPGEFEIPGNSIDEDCDGFDAALDNDSDTYDNTVDCNDSDPAINPGATEICDGLDNNCDGNTDEGITLNTYYLDFDTDGYGTVDSSITSCVLVAPVGYSANSSDCNDSNIAINPGIAEICDGIDNNCAGGVDEGLTLNTYYQDLDADNYGNPAVSVSDCAAPIGYVSNNGDCDDNNILINPLMTDNTGNSIDENCDGVDGTLGLNSLEAQLGITIYPNPASDILYLKGEVNGQLQLLIYNLQGQVVFTQFASMHQQYQLDISQLTPGSYILEMTSLETYASGHTRLIIAK